MQELLPLGVLGPESYTIYNYFTTLSYTLFYFVSFYFQCSDCPLEVTRPPAFLPAGDPYLGTEEGLLLSDQHRVKKTELSHRQWTPSVRVQPTLKEELIGFVTLGTYRIGNGYYIEESIGLKEEVTEKVPADSGRYMIYTSERESSSKNTMKIVDFLKQCLNF